MAEPVPAGKDYVSLEPTSNRPGDISVGSKKSPKHPRMRSAIQRQEDASLKNSQEVAQDV